MSGTASIDQDAIAAYSLIAWNYKQGQMVTLMIQLGNRLGLYKALDGAGPLSAAELSTRTGLHERWLFEWLRGQAAAKLLDYQAADDADRFELSEIGAMVLARESAPTFAAAAFDDERPPDYVERLSGSFRDGLGLTYDDLGPACAHNVARMLGPLTKALLVPVVIPALDGVRDKLSAGAHVADVGCGVGVALEELAAAFPNSQFVGYDLSRHAIDVGSERLAAAGVTNARLEHRRAEQIPDDGRFDLILTFDCLHDMTRPDLAIAAVYRALRDDGTWLAKDIRSSPSFIENMRNPLLPLMYASSVATCMSSAMSEPGGMGLGTLGFNPVVAEQMARAAGFTRFVTHDLPDRANFYYEVRR